MKNIRSLFVTVIIISSFFAIYKAGYYQGYYEYHGMRWDKAKISERMIIWKSYLTQLAKIGIKKELSKKDYRDSISDLAIENGVPLKTAEKDFEFAMGIQAFIIGTKTTVHEEIALTKILCELHDDRCSWIEKKDRMNK